MRIAVIPARGGSKRIPRKNIKLFAGRPMIEWSIQVAHESSCFDRVIVSTDDDEIAMLSEAAGAEAPFRRPASLSDDFTGTTEVIAHAIDWLAGAGPAPTLVCCIYATAPFLSADDIRAGLDTLLASGTDYVFSVAPYPFPIQRAIRINGSGRVEMFQPGNISVRSQDLEPSFHDAGQFYWGRAEAWSAGRPIFSPAAAPIVIPDYRVRDIDTPEDWISAEWMFRAMNASPDE